MNASDFLNATLAVAALALALIAEPVAAVPSPEPRRDAFDCVAYLPSRNPFLPPHIRQNEGMWLACADTALGMAWRET